MLLAKHVDPVTAGVEESAARIHDINEMLYDPTFFDRTSRDHVKKLENQQTTLSGKIEELPAEWESPRMPDRRLKSRSDCRKSMDPVTSLARAVISPAKDVTESRKFAIKPREEASFSAGYVAKTARAGIANRALVPNASL